MTKLKCPFGIKDCVDCRLFLTTIEDRGKKVEVFDCAIKVIAKEAVKNIAPFF